MVILLKNKTNKDQCPTHIGTLGNQKCWQPRLQSKDKTCKPSALPIQSNTRVPCCSIFVWFIFGRHSLFNLCVIYFWGQSLFNLCLIYFCWKTKCDFFTCLHSVHRCSPLYQITQYIKHTLMDTHFTKWRKTNFNDFKSYFNIIPCNIFQVNELNENCTWWLKPFIKVPWQWMKSVTWSVLGLIPGPNQGHCPPPTPTSQASP